MSRAEQAWEHVNKVWHPYSEVKSSSEATERLKGTIRQLQAMRLPIAAIDLIGAAIRQAGLAALETSFCEACGERCDGMTQCTGCKRTVEILSVDSVNGKCTDCQEDDGDEEAST